MKNVALALFSLLLLAAVSSAHYRHVHGNVYQYVPSGLYYQYYPSYYQNVYYPNGCYVQLYNYVPPLSYTTNSVVNNYPVQPVPNWKELSIKAIVEIDENRTFQATRDAIMAYAGGPHGYVPQPFGTYRDLRLSAFQQQGSTLYAQNAGVQLGNPPDIDRWIQQVAQNIQSVGTIWDNGQKDFSDELSKEGARRSARLDYMAKAQAAAMFMQSLNGPPTTTSIDVRQRTGPAPLPQDPSPAPVPNAMNNLSPQQIDVLWQASAQQCVGCHGEKTERKFSVFRVDSYDDEFRAAILARIHPSAPEAKRMPRNKDGTAGRAIPESEYNIWRARLALKVQK